MGSLDLKQQHSLDLKASLPLQFRIQTECLVEVIPVVVGEISPSTSMAWKAGLL